MYLAWPVGKSSHRRQLFVPSIYPQPKDSLKTILVSLLLNPCLVKLNAGFKAIKLIRLTGKSGEPDFTAQADHPEWWNCGRVSNEQGNFTGTFRGNRIEEERCN